MVNRVILLTVLVFFSNFQLHAEEVMDYFEMTGQLAVGQEFVGPNGEIIRVSSGNIDAQYEAAIDFLRNLEPDRARFVIPHDSSDVANRVIPRMKAIVAERGLDVAFIPVEKITTQPLQTPGVPKANLKTVFVMESIFLMRSTALTLGMISVGTSWDLSITAGLVNLLSLNFFMLNDGHNFHKFMHFFEGLAKGVTGPLVPHSIKHSEGYKFAMTMFANYGFNAVVLVPFLALMSPSWIEVGQSFTDLSHYQRVAELAVYMAAFTYSWPSAVHRWGKRVKLWNRILLREGPAASMTFFWPAFWSGEVYAYTYMGIVGGSGLLAALIGNNFLDHWHKVRIAEGKVSVKEGVLTFVKSFTPNRTCNAVFR